MANAAFTKVAKVLLCRGIILKGLGGLAENRTRVHGFAVRCVTTPPRGQVLRSRAGAALLGASYGIGQGGRRFPCANSG